MSVSLVDGNALPLLVGKLNMRTRCFLNPSDTRLSFPQQAEHVHVVCNSAEAGFTVTLPDANMQESREFVFYNHPKTGAGNNVSVVPVSGQLINGKDTTHTLIPYDSATFVSDLRNNWLLSDINQ
jgi:hypothetical protein